ncbi:U3 small nucleolar RNA-associated protein 6 homolog isoform X3 [Gopherus evgoodei]|uniref:U3 small nucleolar RNA-associated protein 6 homolog isoform X3 n=1 Tax=Gopherus evgoodei TaxID=1825980 RepID=UPI0011CF7AF8|nr:U3 small nucleolar RNA-associated protein 6 homolog isoform X3 [Gopherus evgoodei]
MAERIEQRIEDRLPELEQLERVGLFTRKEIKAVIKKASALEYKIQRRALHKEDFINYIQYEINLLELIKKRRSRIGYSFKKDEIEYSIVQRIHGLFKRATEKWKDDVQLWLSHVAFCRKWNKKNQLSKVFSAMLAIHPNKPALWIMAAKWEMEERFSSESARHLFLRALRFHPESPKLYQEYFRMELMHAEKQRKEKKEFEQAKMDLGEFSYSEEVLNGEMARIIYRNAVEKIKGAEFYLSLLSIAKLFDFTQDLQKEILENLQAENADDPFTWDYMARRELEMGSLPSPECSSKQMKASEVTQKEERCCAVFEEAVTALPTEAMWKCYVTFCLERLKRKTNSEELRRKGCLPLWTLWVEWSEGANSKEDTQALYQRSLFVIDPADSVTMKVKYLDWAYRDGGYKKAKKVFTSLHESHPLSLEFFRKMIEIEKGQESCKMVNLREYYERALREFGSTDSDLWLDYIREELSHPQGKPVNCGNIHWRALKMLGGELVEKFVSKYTLLQTGHL